jgi:hypothetical protein
MQIIRPRRTEQSKAGVKPPEAAVRAFMSVLRVYVLLELGRIPAFDSHVYVGRV